MEERKFRFEPIDDVVTGGGIVKAAKIHVLGKKGIIAILYLTKKGIGISSKSGILIEADLFTRVGIKNRKAIMDLKPNFGQPRKKITIVPHQ